MRERPKLSSLNRLLVVLMASITGALALFWAGGGIANVSNASNALGITFQASGGVAGFVIVFVLSTRELRRLDAVDSSEARPKVALVRLRLVGTPRKLRRDDNYQLRCTVTDADGHQRDITPRRNDWLQSMLVLELHDLCIDDWIMAELTDEQGERWVVDRFQIHEPTVVAMFHRPKPDRWVASPAHSNNEQRVAVSTTSYNTGDRAFDVQLQTKSPTRNPSNDGALPRVDEPTKQPIANAR